VRAITERSWVAAPVSSGWGLWLTKPKLLDELLNWADIAMVEFPWQFDYCYRRRPAQRFVLATHNVEIAKFTDYALAERVRPENNRWLRAIEKIERRAVARARLVLAVSPADKMEFVERYGADTARIVEVPNGADTTCYKPTPETARKRAKRDLGLSEKPVILFVGSDAPPNRVALQWMERLAQRTNRFTFLAVGRVCGQSRVEGNFHRIGEVDDCRPYMRAADVSLCSLEHGGGTKIKLMEALAAALPTVTFRKCLHGTALRDGEHLLVTEPDVESMLAALDRLVLDPELAERIGCNGRDHVAEHHDWDGSAERLEEALLVLTTVRATSGPRSPLAQVV